MVLPAAKKEELKQWMETQAKRSHHGNEVVVIVGVISLPMNEVLAWGTRR